MGTTPTRPNMSPTGRLIYQPGKDPPVPVRAPEESGGFEPSELDPLVTPEPMGPTNPDRPNNVTPLPDPSIVPGPSPRPTPSPGAGVYGKVGGIQPERPGSMGEHSTGPNKISPERIFPPRFRSPTVKRFVMNDDRLNPLWAAPSQDWRSTQRLPLGIYDAPVDLCPGADVLIRGCTPPHTLQHVGEFSTEPVEAKMVLIGAGVLVALALIAEAAAAAAAALAVKGIIEGAAVALSWGRLLVAVL